MDKVALGLRLAQAREDAGMTQDGLGNAVGLDRTAISRLEKGERKLSATELVTIADALDRPLAYFVSTPVAAVVSRRRDLAHAHGTTRALGEELGQFASDTRTLMEMGAIHPVERASQVRVPRSHDEAENMAAACRHRLHLGVGPVGDLGLACEQLGLYSYSAPLGKGGPDGGCVELSDAAQTLGAAVINGDTPAGRRRMTLAHELGHWLAGDAYDRESSIDDEKMLNSFAIHFLAPRAGVHTVWSEHPGWHTRDRALAVGASFRLSWSAALGQLRNVNLINHDDHRLLSADEPRYGDYLRLGLRWSDELSSPYVSPSFAAACVNAYVSGRITSARAVELLRGTLKVGDLPRLALLTINDLRRSFAGHDE